MSDVIIRVQSLCPRCEGRGKEGGALCTVCDGHKTLWKFTKAMNDEFAYTTWEMSCKDPAAFGTDLRECRRPKHHSGRHASGFRTAYREWGAPAY